ncbi:MAG: dTDP-4-dehydrorhamnose 3,5-epimerase [Saprospiraceae bacterium]
MEAFDTGIKGLKLIKPHIISDERGYFFESYSKVKFPSDGQNNWVQDNESKSKKGVLRGLHYQIGKQAQAKLVRAVVGAIYDVAVDIRSDSDTYGKWYGAELNDVNKLQMLIPRGFAHGFLVLSDQAIFSYKCDNYYNKESEGGIIYNDPNLDITWPRVNHEANLLPYQLSEKDNNLPVFENHIPFK